MSPIMQTSMQITIVDTSAVTVKLPRKNRVTTTQAMMAADTVVTAASFRPRKRVSS